MAEKGDQKNDDGKSGGSKRLTREDYDRLVQGVDDIFFGGKDEPEAEQEPPLGKPDEAAPKRDGDGK